MEVGLLCVEMNKEDRPTIEDVLGMLNGVKELPSPKQPRGVDLARKRPSNLICPESGSLVPLVVPKADLTRRPMGRREADVASGRADAAGPEPGHVCGSVQNATAAGMLVRSA